MPATKVTGKWLFPRRLLDEWLIESAHGGALADRLVVGGSDDPLLAAAVAFLAQTLGDSALVALAPTGTRVGLALLARQRVHVAAIHWGLADASHIAHVRLVAQYPRSREWTIVRMARREQGIIVRHDLRATSLAELAHPGLRWAMRQEGSGSQHLFRALLAERGLPFQILEVASTALTERHAAAMVAQGLVDCAPGARSASAEFGLSFLPLAWEAFDLVVARQVFFRELFQQLLAELRSERVRELAYALHGYDLAPLGTMLALPAER